MLVQLNITDFVNELASDSPAPGGGSVSALSGALAAGLIAMVCRLTIGKKDFEAQEEIMKKTLERAELIGRELHDLIDADTEAFNGVMAAFRMPKGTDEEKAARTKAVQSAFQQAVDTPLRMVRHCGTLLELALDIAEHANPNCISDLGVAAQTAFAGVNGAVMNVRINLPSIRDAEFTGRAGAEAAGILEQAGVKKEKLDRIVSSRLS